MARIIHCADPDKDMAKVITLNETPENPGITVRYTDFGSAVLMAAFIFRGRCRYGIKLMTAEEKAAYQAERAALMVGSDI